MIGPPTCRQIVSGRPCGGETAVHSTDPVTLRVLSRQCLSCGHVVMDPPNGPSREQLWNERERTLPMDERWAAWLRRKGETERSIESDGTTNRALEDQVRNVSLSKLLGMTEPKDDD